MNIFIQELEMCNFKGHRTFKSEFSELVKVSGKNGEGKSSIGEAITWNLYGTDTMGNTLDPTPLYEYEGESSTTVLLKADEKVLKLKRAIENGKNLFYVNDIPTKATDYKLLIDSLFEKNLFLSIFNPGYYSSQHWKDQRAQLLRYIDEPLNKEVFENMTNVCKVQLEEPMKKHSLNELDKLHKERFKKRDKEIERAGARVTTLKEQYQKSLGDDAVDLKDIKAQMIALETEISQDMKVNSGIENHEKKLNELNLREKFIREQILKKKELIDRMSKTPLQENCNECGQPLDYNATETAKQNQQERIQSVKMEGKDLVHGLEEIKKSREALGEPGEKIDNSQKMQELEKYRHILLDSHRISELEQEIRKAEEDLQAIRFERNESQGILEAIKEFVDVKAGLMVSKVNALFETLSVKLFEQQKNDSIKQTFEIEMDGKPFGKLSTAERVRAGVELIHVLQMQSGVVGPTFIDNAESILNLKVAPGQAIISTVKNNKLKIEGGQLS